jgi:putative DNA primase/helicase
MTGPYAQSAPVYRQQAWPAPLPVVGKHPPVAGFTGRDGAWADDAQVAEWINTRGGDNICLRLPDTVIGIDVDAYDGRRGAETIAFWTEQTGVELPPTWFSTSRDDGESGIYLFRVPAGVRWRSDLGTGSDVQIIRTAHRYAVVWPSIHPGTSRMYRWHTPAQEPADGPPAIAELADLPPAWVDALRRGGAGGAGGGMVGDATRGGTDHSGEDVDTFDMDGQPVEVDDVFENGIPAGSQNSVLYAYLSSLRARGAKRIEMITLGWTLIQRCENSREPWTVEDVIAKVDEVRRDYAPGSAALAGLSPEMRDFADRLRRGEVADDEPPPRDPLATDLGNTLRFARLMRDRVRYAADENRWYVWDGNRWAVDITNQVLELTTEVIDDIRHHAFVVDGTDRAAWIRWAQQSEALVKRRAMLDGAKGHPDLVVTADQFDRDPWLLVVRNGTVDLRTGQLRPSDPADMCTRRAEVDYDAGADCPRWKDHIRFITSGSEELAVYLMCMAGYSLTGLTSERAFWFLEGDGLNGKNVFVEPILFVMGSYASVASSSLLTGGDEQHPTILADLRGTRFVFIDEVRQGKRLNVERIKALTGSKRVKARRMREDFFEFDAQFKLWIAGNGQPTVKDPSDGAWDRMKRVPFLAKVAPDQLRRDHAQTLYDEEAPGILNWLLAGARYWSEQRDAGVTVAVPTAVREAVSEHRHSEDVVEQFLEEYPIVHTGLDAHVISANEVYARYRNWAIMDVGLSLAEAGTAIQFGMRLVPKIGAKSGIKRYFGEGDARRKLSAYVGYRWATEGDDAEGTTC